MFVGAKQVQRTVPRRAAREALRTLGPVLHCPAAFLGVGDGARSAMRGGGEGGHLYPILRSLNPNIMVVSPNFAPKPP